MSGVINKFKALFEAYGEGSPRETFKDELNYEADRIFYVFFVAVFTWLPYRRYDFALHQFPVFAFTFRSLFSVISAALIIMKLTRRFKKRPDILFIAMVASMYFLTAIVSASAGEHAPTYTGGMCYVWVLPAFSPLPLKIKYSLQVSAVAVYFLVGLLTGMDFASFVALYGFSDLLIVFVITIFLSYMLNDLRYRSWVQRRELIRLNAVNEKNLAVISELAEKAGASAREKAEYLNTLSHEVRTPLTVISNYTQLAVRQFRQGQIDERTIDGLEAVNAEALRIAELASKVLSPKEYGDKAVDLAEIARQLARLYMPAVAAGDRALGVTLTKKLPTSCNAGEITQVVWNLLDNAVKHGGGNIDVDGNLNDEYVYIIVSDYGDGIPPEILPDVLKRGVSGKGGSGLGLAIADEIARKHGGRLIVDSEYGLGTAVTLLLPVYRGDADGYSGDADEYSGDASGYSGDADEYGCDANGYSGDADEEGAIG